MCSHLSTNHETDPPSSKKKNLISRGKTCKRCGADTWRRTISGRVNRKVWLALAGITLIMMFVALYPGIGSFCCSLFLFALSAGGLISRHWRCEECKQALWTITNERKVTSDLFLVLGKGCVYTIILLSFLGLIYRKDGIIYDHTLKGSGQIVLGECIEWLRLASQKDLNHSLLWAQRNLETAKTFQGPDSLQALLSLQTIGLIYKDQAQFTQSKKAFMESLSIAEKVYGPDHDIVALSLNNLAFAQANLGEYAQAKFNYEQAIAMSERIHGREYPAAAVMRVNLAMLYYYLSEYSLAKHLYELALTILEKIHGPEHADVAMSLNNLALIYDHLGEYAQAKSLYERALIIWEKVFGLEHPNRLITLDNLAKLYHSLGEYSQSESIYKRVLATREKILGPNHLDVAITLNNLALLYVNYGKYDLAKPLFERALLIAVNSDHSELLWRTQFNMGHLLAKRGNPNAAIFYYKQAVNTLQRIRENIIALEDRLQKTFLQSKEYVYKNLAQLLIEQGRLPEAQQALSMLKEEEYHDFIRRDRNFDTRNVTAQLNEYEAEWLKRYQEIKGRIASIGQELGAIKKKKRSQRTLEDVERLKILNADLNVAQQSFRDTLRKLELAFAELDKERYAELKQKQLDTDLRGLVKELGEGAVLIHYLMLEDTLQILVTTPETLLAREVPVGEKDLNVTIQVFRTLLQDPLSDPRPTAHQLYQHLIKPIDEDLKQAQAKTLMISLDGTLRYVPFAALYDGERYLVERYPTAIFTEASRDKVEYHPNEGWELAGMGLSREITGFKPLYAVPRELESIIRKDEDDQDGVVDGVIYLDEKFTDRTLRNSLLDEYSVLHIASHFVFHAVDGLSSYLLLGDGSKLTLEKIKNEEYNLNAVELLTLSACETAMNTRKANGKEIEGFGALAQKKGAKGVMATLWPVVDESTGIFMNNFYRIHEEQQGVSKAETLRQSQLLFLLGDRQSMDAPASMGSTDETSEFYTFIPNPETPYAHPYYWAPFILMGNWL